MFARIYCEHLHVYLLNIVRTSEIANMTTLDMILTRYGVLVSLGECAEIFKTTPNSIRMQMGRNSNLGLALQPHTVRQGRRVLFKSAGIASIIDAGDTAIQP